MLIDQFVAWHIAEQDRAAAGSVARTGHYDRKARVQKLFQLARFNGQGGVNVEMLATSKGAPSWFVERLNHMRPGIGGLVDLAGWEAAFEMDIESLPADNEFADRMDGLETWLEIISTIYEAMKITGEESSMEEDDEPTLEELPPMPSDRQQKVDQLFAQLDPVGRGKFGLTALSQRSVKLGPHTSTPFDLIARMDSDGDGDVTHEEMVQYFQHVSAQLNDSEFNDVIQMCGLLVTT